MSAALSNFVKTPFGYGSKDTYSKEDDMDLRAQGRMLYNEKLTAPSKGDPKEMMVLTFLGNGEEWVLADKYSSTVSSDDAGKLMPGFSQSPVIIDQYGTHTKPQAIAAALAKTTLLSNREEGSAVREQIKSLYNNPINVSEREKRVGGKRGKRVNTEKAKRSNMRKSKKQHV
jgi:hypothetical protein